MLYSVIFLRVSVLSKFSKKWVPGVIFHEEFEKNGVKLPKSKHPILVGIITRDLKPLCSICETFPLSDFFKISPVICVLKSKNRGKKI